MKYKIEDIVYLKTDLELLPRLITKYEVSKNNIVYNLVCGTVSTWHFDFEFTANKEELNKQIGFNKDANA